MDEEEAPRGHGKSMLVMALGAALLLGAVWLLAPMPLDCTLVMRLFVSKSGHLNVGVVPSPLGSLKMVDWGRGF